jgi:all-trans-8'-apo-beta-carotenal 15,15'-oxygenase
MMKRRDFLSRLGMSAGAILLARQGWSRSPMTRSWLEDFRSARADAPWLSGWDNFDEDVLAERSLRWRGKPPRGLRGTLFRNGPARFERAGMRYHHWFDGDGLMQAWRIGDGTVSHRARMIATDKYRAEQRAGRFTRAAAGTWIPDADSMRNSDDINVANTAVTMHADRLYALWEGGSAWELDPETLASRGPRTWREDLQSVPFSAHPLRDRDGTLWNFGIAAYGSAPTLVVWRIGADGELSSIATLTLEMPGYIHSFAMTRGHLVFVIAPWLLEPEGTGAFFERMRWRPELGSEVIVLAKDALDRPIRHRLPGGLAFHYGSAFENDGRIIMNACWYDDAASTNRDLSNLMRGRIPPASDGRSEPLVRIELPLDGRGRASLTRLGPVSLEFPTWDIRHQGPGGQMYFAAQRDRSAPYLDSIVAWSDRRETMQLYHYGEGWLAEEHVFAASSPDSRRDHGWLLGTALDTRKGSLWLSVFDATRVGDGPVCQAELPRSLPLGFHGAFVPS